MTTPQEGELLVKYEVVNRVRGRSMKIQTFIFIDPLVEHKKKFSSRLNIDSGTLEAGLSKCMI